MIKDAILTHLRIKNLRQHSDTEIAFEPDKQLLLFSGQNGHGKTTIFEAISYALYGQPRKTFPRTTLDSLVRWGADLEGLQVELDFTMGETNYSIRRRYVQGRSEATLTENGVLTTNSSGEVAKKVTLLFGLDADGFRNAVVSEQQELAGLTSMDSARRMKVISKITGITDLTNAAKEAKAEVAAHRKLIKEIGPAPDVPGATAAVELEEQTLEALTLTQQDLQKVVDDLAAELRASSHVEQEYRRRVQEKATASGAADSAQATADTAARNHVQAQARLDAATKPEVTLSAADLLPIRNEAQAALITAKEHNAAVAQGLAVAARITAREAELAERNTAAQALTDEIAEIRQNASTFVDTPLDDIQATIQGTTNTVFGLRQKVTERQELLQQLKDLPAQCPECHQPVSDEHKAQHQERANAEIAEFTAQIDLLTRDLEHQQELREESAHHNNLLAQIERKEQTLAQVQSEIRAITSKIEADTQEQETYPSQAVDMDPLNEAMNRASADVEAALAQQRQVQEYQRLEDGVTAAQTVANQAQTAAAEAHRRVEELQIPDTLIGQVEQWQQTSQRFAAEKDLLHETSLDVVACTGRLNAARQHLARLESDQERRTQLLSTLEVAAATERLLDTAAKRAAAQLRPALEGTLSSLLTTMSGGLYTEARLSSAYSVTVVKAGEERPLNSFSGGEKDLIGLALRLALAQTVAARNSGTGPGFLILDEILGSQDSARQATIFEALRSMKDIYPQVFIISHTAGAEDLADVVYETTASPAEDGGPLEATVVSYT